MYVCRYVCMKKCMCVCLLVCLSVCLPASLPACTSFCLSVFYALPFLQGAISHSFTTEVKFDPLGAGQVWTNSVEKITQGKKPSEVVLALSLTETG